jgi:hypothetical protein
MFYHFTLLEKVIELGQTDIFLKRQGSESSMFASTFFLNRTSISNNQMTSKLDYQSFYNQSSPQLGNFVNPKSTPLGINVTKSISDYNLNVSPHSTFTKTTVDQDEIPNCKNSKFQESPSTPTENIMKQDLLCIILHAAGKDYILFF